MTLSTIAKVEAAVGQPLEVVARGVYTVPGWPTMAMDRITLLKWANSLIAATGEGALAVASRFGSRTAVARAQYRKQAAARSQAQAMRFASLLGV